MCCYVSLLFFVGVCFVYNQTNKAYAQSKINKRHKCFLFHLVHLILSMGIIIIKHYITEVEKQNKFYEKRTVHNPYT